MSKLYAFAGYRCHCCTLAETMVEIPAVCPEHNESLLGPMSWEANPQNVPLGRVNVGSEVRS